MRPIRQLMVAGIVAALISGAQAGEEQLAPGMTPQEVVGIMGPPTSARLERNGVQCLVYRASERRVTNLIFLRDVLVAVFLLGHLATVETVYASDAETRCSQIAADWDRPVEHPVTCFRKLYLRCEP
jgi:hypothetical protein